LRMGQGRGDMLLVSVNLTPRCEISVEGWGRGRKEEEDELESEADPAMTFDAAATAANLALWRYLKLKTAHGSPALKDQLGAEALTVHPSPSKGEKKDSELDWHTGEVYAEGESLTSSTPDIKMSACRPTYSLRRGCRRRSDFLRPLRPRLTLFWLTYLRHREQPKTGLESWRRCLPTCAPLRSSAIEPRSCSRTSRVSRSTSETRVSPFSPALISLGTDPPTYAPLSLSLGPGEKDALLPVRDRRNRDPSQVPRNPLHPPRRRRLCSTDRTRREGDHVRLWRNLAQSRTWHEAHEIRYGRSWGSGGGYRKYRVRK
jgi:hypothetical protein